MSPTANIRVMIVDDSLIVRRLVEDSLREAPGIEVVGTAQNGKLALEKIGTLRPDVVTLDVEMPEMDGLTTLRQLRARHPQIHVIMFSSLTVKQAGVTLEALAAGASDYVTKPQNVPGGMTATRERIRGELVPKVQALCARKPAPLPIPAATPARPRVTPAGAPSLVAIGVSTGGPAALHTLVPLLPPSLGIPIVIVQHMPPEFTSQLATRLAAIAKMPVTEARHGERLDPNHIYIAPGGKHLVVNKLGAQLVVELDDGPPENSCKPAVDVLFRSAARVVGAHTLGIVMTGMGQDGLKGSEAIRGTGGRVFVQDAASSVVWGMPGAVARAGFADRTLPLNQLAPAIEATLGRGSPLLQAARTDVRGRL